MSKNFIFEGSVSEIDPELNQLLQREDDRQDTLTKQRSAEV